MDHVTTFTGSYMKVIASYMASLLSEKDLIYRFLRKLFFWQIVAAIYHNSISYIS